MKNEDLWRPTKFLYSKGRLIPGPGVSPGSWLSVRLIAERYEDQLPRYARGALLDLGCGAVPLYEVYRPLVDTITCVDWPGGAHGDSYLDVFHDLNEPLPFADGEQDTVILSDVLEHVHEPAALLREIGRVLASDGVLIANVPFFYWLHEEPYDFYRYTEHALRRLCEAAGLSVLSLEALGGGPCVLADVLSKHVTPLPMAGPVSARVLQRMTYFVISRGRIHRLLKQSRHRFPLSYFLVAKKRGG